MASEVEGGPEGPSEDPFVGTVLNGRFQVVRRIARGGMASVYFATQSPLSRPVAIKVVSCVEPGSEENFRRRFLREASILARLQHPNIVTLLDYGPIDDVPEAHYFMAMEFLQGETLAKRFKRVGRLGIEESIRMAHQVGRGLRETHRHGFIHRDLKPSNIMLVPEDDRNDIVKLLDFGIGKIVSARSEVYVDKDGEEMTGAGLMLGSPRYMSPEQIRSEPVEGRTDLYGLGVILFQALTGRLPFEGRTDVEVLLAHCSTLPPTLAQVCPDQFFPQSLSRLVRSLLEKKPENRPTVEEFLEQLVCVEEEVFGAVGLAGPTLQGLSAVRPALRSPSSSGIRWDRFSAGPAVDLDATPVLGTAPPPPSLPPPAVTRRKTLVTGVAGVSLFALLSAPIWIMVQLLHAGPDADGREGGAVPAKIPALAVERVVRPAQTTAGAGSSRGTTSFTLQIDSVPTAAIVSEGDTLLGTTPLTLTVERATVSAGPRHFVLSREGYAKFVLEQGDSTILVRARAALEAIGRGGNERSHRHASRRGVYAASASGGEGSGGRSAVARSKIARARRVGSLKSSAPGLAPASAATASRRSGGPPALEIRTSR